MFFIGTNGLLIVASIIWIVWYFMELPKNIRELKENRREYRNYRDLSVLGEFKAKTEEDINEERCRIEYKGNLGLIILFSIVTAVAIIYTVHSLIELAKSVIPLFHGGFLIATKMPAGQCFGRRAVKL
jgi:hypothetical protein